MEHCTKISRAWLIFQRPILCRQVKKSPDAPFSGAMASLRCCGRSVQRLRTALALHAEGRGGGSHRFRHPRSRHFWGNRSDAEERLAGSGDRARSRETSICRRGSRAVLRRVGHDSDRGRRALRTSERDASRKSGDPDERNCISDCLRANSFATASLCLRAPAKPRKCMQIAARRRVQTAPSEA
jgi:hypothetical protein